MTPCELCRAMLPQYIADGEPLLPGYTVLQAHLRTCPACRAYAARLHAVEDALRTYPMVAAPPQVAAQILSTLGEPTHGTETWEPLPRSVWSPLMVTVVVAAMVFLSIAQVDSGLFWANLESTFVNWAQPQHVAAASRTLTIRQEDFWAVWCGIFVSISGLGLCVALSSWNARHHTALYRLEALASERASRFWQNVRHAE
ncbi:MAG: hypothetical protein ACYC5M_07595 [Anaerolineae bacterium]